MINELKSAEAYPLVHVLRTLNRIRAADLKVVPTAADPFVGATLFRSASRDIGRTRHRPPVARPKSCLNYRPRLPDRQACRRAVKGPAARIREKPIWHTACLIGTISPDRERHA
jgi:hypothetical protein